MERQLGHRAADWTGNVAWLDAVRPEERERVQPAFMQSYDGAQGTCDESLLVEFRLQDAVGHWRWLESRGQAQCSIDGLVLCMAGFAVDVAPRKRAETALVTHQVEPPRSGLAVHRCGDPWRHRWA
ncbi:PAS domain-containing protein [Hydrogenophaga intermedia]|nr:PAS domain-containing protein [Hydrogenophaga intermedia]